MEITDELIDSLKLEQLEYKPEVKKINDFQDRIVKLSIQMTNFTNACVTLIMGDQLSSQQKLKIRKIFETGIDLMTKWTNPNMADAVVKKIQHDKLEEMRRKYKEDLMNQ